MIRYPSLCTSGAVNARTAAQQRYALCHIAGDALAPPAINSTESRIERETLLGCRSNQLARPVIQYRGISVKGKQSAAQRQTRYQRRRMRQGQSLAGARITMHQCLLREPETKKGNS